MPKFDPFAPTPKKRRPKLKPKPVTYWQMLEMLANPAEKSDSENF